MSVITKAHQIIESTPDMRHEMHLGSIERVDSLDRKEGIEVKRNPDKTPSVQKQKR